VIPYNPYAMWPMLAGMSGRSVVYVALGARRVQAAVRLTAQAAADGAEVLLVVPDSAAWRDIEPPPGVTLRRLPRADQRRTARAARRLLLSVAAGSVLVAGDAPAMPVAEAVGRRRRDVSVVVEPDAAPRLCPAHPPRSWSCGWRKPGGDRHKGNHNSKIAEEGEGEADLVVVTPWYPGPNDDFGGAFVRATTDAVRDQFARVSVVHTEGWFYAKSEAASDAVDAAAARVGTVTEQGEVTRIAVPSETCAGYPTWMDAHVRALRAALPTGRIEAPIVHAHTGVYGGMVAAALARADARVVITEHATFLPRVFRQPGARSRYAAALHRADAVLCVGPGLLDYLATEFPAYAGKLHVVPNPIDFDRFTLRSHPPEDLRKWLYVGRLVEHKGVRLLLEAFALVDDPTLTLTLVGAGPLEAALRVRAAALGLQDRVRLHPPVPPDRVASLLAEHDLLVHLSTVETFGLTVVEAIATGTPVLVARSEGTQETMAGLHGRAGLLIDPDGDPAAVAEAYRELEKRLPELDLAGARAELQDRYGREAVAARLRHFYTATPQRHDPAPPPGPENRLLAAARRRRGPALEIAVRRAHGALLRWWRAASRRLPRR
jgi:glycosyltransferase involved in cell wall biosynthesis